jgi:hypothetical protein
VARGSLDRQPPGAVGLDDHGIIGVEKDGHLIGMEADSARLILPGEVGEKDTDVSYRSRCTVLGIPRCPEWSLAWIEARAIRLQAPYITHSLFRKRQRVLARAVSLADLARQAGFGCYAEAGIHNDTVEASAILFPGIADVRRRGESRLESGIGESGRECEKGARLASASHDSYDRGRDGVGHEVEDVPGYVEAENASGLRLRAVCRLRR